MDQELELSSPALLESDLGAMVGLSYETMRKNKGMVGVFERKNLQIIHEQ